MDKVKKILILGASGMLGSIVFKYFHQKKLFLTKGTLRDINDFSSKTSLMFPFSINGNIVPQMHSIIQKFDPDYIINCIGIINKHCRDNDPVGIQNAIKINSSFPWELSAFFSKYSQKTRIIQIGTDCVFSGSQGGYSEDSMHDAIDVYGKTKSLGEVISNNLLNIRCSIIGPELKNKKGLLEWFLSQTPNSTVTGYAHHKWNGVTTLQFAQYCEELIVNNQVNEYLKRTNKVHYCPNESITKYMLLQKFQDVFKTNYRIEFVDNIGIPINRTLISKYSTPENNDIKKALEELKIFMDNNY